MNAEASRALARDLFQLMKQLPRSRLTPDSVEGLTHSEHEFLLLLAICYDKAGAALSVTELSTLLQITPAGVTHLINPLEQAGFVERLQAPNDRRIVRIG